MTPEAICEGKHLPQRQRAQIIQSKMGLFCYEFLKLR
jgi:hypothetical protein